jgi:predicted ATPase/class 3 adenylate cyclase
MTDIQGSTLLWETDGHAMEQAVARHNQLIEEAVQASGGFVLKNRGEGDALFCVFHHPSDAIAAAVSIQERMASESWSTARPISVRVAIHSGEADLRDGDYYGPTVNRCARIRAVIHGGQSVVSDSARLLALDAGLALTLSDLGEHRLKDLHRPERIWQVDSHEPPSSFPPLASLGYFPNNLPFQISSFIGREADIARIRDLFADSRLVVLSGTGGSGKTRLALQYGAETLERYPDGTWFVELAPIEDLAQIVPAVASAARLGQQVSDSSQLAERLGSKSCLLILDNCEHLIDACASVIEELLGRCSGISILATSRTALGVVGEHCLGVHGLAYPTDEAETDANPVGYESVQLFVERAKAVDPGFTMNPRNARIVASLCKSVDGLPLAIQLAAAKVRALSAEEILEERQKGLGILSTQRPSGYRHASMEAAIASSYEPLSVEETLLLGRLTVFRGGWNLRAAREVVCDQQIPTDMLPALIERLVAKSLVEVSPQLSGVTRYRLLEPIREFVQGRNPLAGQKVAPRHFEWIARLASDVEEELNRSVGPETIARIEAEQRNLEKAFEWAMSNGRELDVLVAATSLYRYWLVRGYIGPGTKWLERSLAACPDTDPVLIGKALNALGVFAEKSGDLGGSLKAHSAALCIRRELGDAVGVASSLSNLGMLSRSIGDLADARAKFQEALRIIEGDPSNKLLPYALANLGCSLVDEDEYDAAHPILTRCIAVSRERNDVQNLCLASLSLADCELKAGRHNRALHLLRSGLEAALSIKDRFCLSRFLYLYAKLLLALERADEAGAYLAGSRTLHGSTEAKATPTQDREWQSLEKSIYRRIDTGEQTKVVKSVSARRIERMFEESRAYLDQMCAT